MWLKSSRRCQVLVEFLNLSADENAQKIPQDGPFNFVSAVYNFEMVFFIPRGDRFHLVRSIFSFHVEMFFVLGEPQANQTYA